MGAEWGKCPGTESRVKKIMLLVLAGKMYQQGGNDKAL